MWRPCRSERLYRMRNNLPPRRTGSVRTRLLSVTGVAVVGLAVGSLVLWHGQMRELFGLAADKEPVVSSVDAPAVAQPPATTLAVETPTPTPTPSRRPSTPAKKTPKPTTKPSYGEESLS